MCIIKLLSSLDVLSLSLLSIPMNNSNVGLVFIFFLLSLSGGDFLHL